MTLLPDKFNFTIWQGATFRSRLTLYTDTGETLRDLTGHTAELIIRDEPQGTEVFTLSTINGRIALGGVNGTIDLFISAEDTAALDWEHGFYDLTLTAGNDGDTDALLYGSFIVKGV